MKNKLSIYFSAFAILLAFSVKGQVNYYGEKIDEQNSITASELKTAMTGKNEMNVKVTGKITEACQSKGCWMKMDLGDGSTMRVKFKDYGFFVPKNSGGKTAVIQGKAFIEETSVAELKHYAEDAGKTKEEIAAIREPKRQLAFEAEGVILKD